MSTHLMNSDDRGWDYQREFHWARKAFSHYYAEEGHDAAMVNLWDCYARAEYDYMHCLDREGHRGLYSRVCAMWSLYVRECDKCDLYKPDRGIPF